MKMIEKTIYDYLNNLEELPAPVYTEMPATYPGKMYLIEKTGGGKTDQISTANIVIQSYGSSLYEAMTLNEAIIDTMLNDFISLDGIGSVKLNSDYNYTDTTTKRYRYQAVFVITYY